MTPEEVKTFELRGNTLCIKRSIHGDCWLTLPTISVTDTEKIKAVTKSLGLKSTFNDVSGVPVASITAKTYYDLLAHARLQDYLNSRRG